MSLRGVVGIRFGRVANAPISIPALLLTLLLVQPLNLAGAPATVNLGQEPPEQSLSGNDNGAPGRAPRQDSPRDDRTPRIDIREAALPTYYLIRENGELAPYFEIPFEEFEQIYRTYRGFDEAEQPVPYSVSQVSINGHIADRMAHLDLDIRVRGNVDGWIRVPLKLDDCSLRAPHSRVDDEVAFLSVEEDGEGLVCWIQAEQGEEVRLELRVVRALESDAELSRLPIRLPSAAFSKLVLDVPIEDAFGINNDEAILQSAEPLDGQGTRFTISGRPSGGFDFSFGQRTETPLSDQRLIATSETSLIVENEQLVRWTATIDVEASGRSVEQFEVLLPTGCELDEEENSGYRVEILSSSSANQAPNTDEQRPLAKVRFLNPSQRVANVVIGGTIRWESANSEQSRLFELVEVVDAVRHVGRVELFVSSREWVVDWELDGALVRAANPSNDSRREIPLAGFSFSRQLGGLSLATTRQPTRIDVEPIQILSASPDEIGLDAIYRISLSGTPTGRLLIDLQDWQLDTVIGNELVRSFERLPEPSTNCAIELDADLLQAQSVFELRVLARLPLEEVTDQIEIGLPYVVDASAAATTLLIDQVESVVMRPERSVFLPIQTSTVAEWYRPRINTTADAAYRRANSNVEAKVPFSLSIRPRAISYRTRVDVRMEESNVRQLHAEIDLDIRNQSLELLELAVPKTLLLDSDLIVRLEEQEWIWTAADVASDDESELIVLELDLPEGIIGQHRLTADYQVLVPDAIPSGAANPDRSRSLELPLVRPILVDGSARRRWSWFFLSVGEGLDDEWRASLPHRYIEIRFEHDLSMEVRPAGEGWFRSNLSEQEGRLVTTYSSSRPLPSGEVMFDVRSLRRLVGSQILVEKRWVQSQLTATDRQDRAVIRLYTERPNVRLRLPLGTSLLRAALNDVALLSPRIEERDGRTELVVSLRAADSQAQVIELWYRYDPNAPANELQLEWPEVIGSDWAERSYWQVVVPRDEHLGWFSSDLSPEHDWRYGPLFFERRTRLQQAELEEWIGVGAQDDATSGANTYLFSSFGRAGESRLYLVGRQLLLLIVSAVTFVTGTLLIYLRSFRQPIVILVVGMLIAALAAIQTELALLALQVAMLGGLFVIVASILRVMLAETPVMTIPLESGVREPVSTATRLAEPEEIAPAVSPRGSSLVVASSSHAELNS